MCYLDHVVRDTIPPVKLKGWLLMKVMKAKKAKPAPEPELLEGEIPTYEEAGFGDEFVSLVARKIKLGERKAVIEAEEQEIKDELLALVSSSGHKSIQVDDYRVIYSEGSTRKTLDPKLLLKNGVAAATILKSTVESQGKPFVTVRQAGAKG